MIKLFNKIKFSKQSNRMRSVANTKIAREIYNSAKFKNVKFLLNKRFSWMNNFINERDKGIEVGSGAGFAKYFIKNKDFKLTDISNDEHLDYKNIDAQNTNFENESFDYVIASNMIHHMPYPIKFFREMNRILKKNGKLIIFESYSSVFFQLATLVMRHEGLDFTVDVWDEKTPISDDDAWSGNIAITNLIFDNKEKFKEKLGNYFFIEYEKLTECLIFLNSGGVTSKTFCIPMNNFFMNILHLIDKFLVKIFPKIFCMGRRIVLVKK